MTIQPLVGAVIPNLPENNVLQASITVQTTDAGWIFQPGAGHFADGTIEFSLTDAGGGQVDFNVQINANFANLLGLVGFYAVGERFEAHTWNRLTSLLREECQK